MRIFRGLRREKSSEKVYKIATDTAFPPFEIPDVNGSDKLTGIDIDILAAIAEDQGFKYELDVLGFDAAVVALESNQADGVIAGMSITDKRKQTYDFSAPYYESGVVMAIAANNDTIKEYKDLAAKKLPQKEVQRVLRSLKSSKSSTALTSRFSMIRPQCIWM